MCSGLREFPIRQAIPKTEVRAAYHRKWPPGGATRYELCVFYYCRTYYKAVRVGGVEDIDIRTMRCVFITAGCVCVLYVRELFFRVCTVGESTYDRFPGSVFNTLRLGCIAALPRLCRKGTCGPREGGPTSLGPGVLLRETVTRVPKVPIRLGVDRHSQRLSLW